MREKFEAWVAGRYLKIDEGEPAMKLTTVETRWVVGRAKCGIGLWENISLLSRREEGKVSELIDT